VTARQAPRYPGAAMLTLLADLEAFFGEDRRCGELDGGVEDGRVWMACECGAGLTRSCRRAAREPREPRLSVLSAARD
jgi:hypothetical protein